jgi:uridine kinase
VAALPPRSRVAVDGVDASGKTTLADAIAAGCPRVLRASIDGFHRPRAQRWARGRLSPEGCYHDTFDLPALRERLLDPFVRGEAVATSVFDRVADTPVEVRATPGPDAVLVVDGVFLQRPELAACWDLVVLLVISDDEVVRRARLRDPGDPDEVERLYRRRYLPAQGLYRAQNLPMEKADVVVDNTDPRRPVALRAPTGDDARRS